MTRYLPYRAIADNRDAGFTIVEVLVALVILSIGLLGVAKLVLFSSHANDSAYLRSQATEVAYEILDNMRANRQAAAAHAYDTALTAAATAPSVMCVGTAAPCSTAQVAAYDIYQWKLRLAAPVGALPSGQGSVVTSPTSPVTATITVQWDDAGAQAVFAASAVGAAAPMTVTLETVL